MRCVLILVTLGLALGGCAKGTGTDNPFGASGYVPSGDDPTDDSDTDTDTDSDSDSSDSAISDGSDGTSGGSSDGSTGGGSDPTTTGVSTSASTTDDTSDPTNATSDPSTTGNTGPGPGQPGTGMWSHCDAGPDPAPDNGDENFGNCIAGATLCIFMDDVNPDGYCSTLGCINPAIDCDPVPTDATSPATCLQADPTNSICALDCSLGQSCPAGMVCAQDVTFDGGATTFDICV